MSSKTNMTIDDFDLLVRSVHREWIQNSAAISVHGDSIFYGGTDKIHIYCCNNGTFWPNIGKTELECVRPNSWFSKKERKKFDATVAIFREMVDGKGSSIEQLICKYVPSAKDIIAEKALVEDGD
jgi:hypothetical protein